MIQGQGHLSRSPKGKKMVKLKRGMVRTLKVSRRWAWAQGNCPKDTPPAWVRIKLKEWSPAATQAAWLLAA